MTIDSDGAAAGRSGHGDEHEPRCLAVEVGPAMLARLTGQAGPALVLTRYVTLDASLLARVMPDLVIAPLFGPGFDILDLAQRLMVLGYRGPLRALTRPLPDPGAVIGEVRGHCRGIDFDLIILAPPAPGD